MPLHSVGTGPCMFPRLLLLEFHKYTTAPLSPFASPPSLKHITSRNTPLPPPLLALHSQTLMMTMLSFTSLRCSSPLLKPPSVSHPTPLLTPSFLNHAPHKTTTIPTSTDQDCSFDSSLRSKFFRRNQLLFDRKVHAFRSENGARPYEFEARNSGCVDDDSKLKIAIVGYGNFGQFLAKTLVRQGHEVLAYSRTDYSDVAQKMGISYFSDADDLCEEHPEVILLCTSILSTENVLKALPLQRLKRSTLFVDVLSVKEFPRNLFLQHLPQDFDILCTHPMFGPESGKNGWNNLPFVFDKVRIGTDEARLSRCNRFLHIFAQEGCRMVEMSCEQHDWHAAGSQFITHTVGRILEKLELESTPINTKGYETLLNLVENTAGDSFDLYYGLFMYNANAMEQLERLDLAFESLKKQLFGHLHDVLRKQLFEPAEKAKFTREETPASKVSKLSSSHLSLSETLEVPKI